MLVVAVESQICKLWCLRSRIEPSIAPWAGTRTREPKPAQQGVTVHRRRNAELYRIDPLVKWVIKSHFWGETVHLTIQHYNFRVTVYFLPYKLIPRITHRLGGDKFYEFAESRAMRIPNLILWKEKSSILAVLSSTFHITMSQVRLTNAQRPKIYQHKATRIQKWASKPGLPAVLELRFPSMPSLSLLKIARI